MFERNLHQHQDHEQRFSARALQALARKKARYQPYHPHFVVSRGPKNKYEDMDYRYKRADPKDYSLNLNPSIPYYSNYVYPPGWNLESNPTTPAPDTIVVDQTAGTNEQEMTKEEWELKFKLEDGTFNMSTDSIGGDYMDYTDIAPQVLPDFIWNWFQYYMRFEKNYSFPNDWFSRNTTFSLKQFNETSSGTIYLQFYFYNDKDGKYSVYQIPTAKYDISNPPVTNPSDQTGSSNQSGKSLMTQSYNTLDTTLPADEWIQKYSDDDGTMFMPEDPTDHSSAYDTGLDRSYQTAWLYDYLTKVQQKDPNSEYMEALRKEGNYWMFANRDDGSDGVFSDIVVYDSSRKSPTGSYYAMSLATNVKLLNFNESEQWWDPENRTREQKFNVDKGVWSGQYMDPSNGRFWLSNHLRYDLRDEFVSWLNDYLRYFEPSKSLLDSNNIEFQYNRDEETSSPSGGYYVIGYRTKSPESKTIEIRIPRSPNIQSV